MKRNGWRIVEVNLSNYKMEEVIRQVKEMILEDDKEDQKRRDRKRRDKMEMNKQ